LCVREVERTQIRMSSRHFMVKLLRVDGGCLGAERRRKTWQAAISLGEPQAGADPGISEWGNPVRVMSHDSELNT
jgi:hypothetical protein